jgi:Flp pilus assembly pilin Flp
MIAAENMEAGHMAEIFARVVAILRKRVQDGQGLVEYALILVLISIFCIAMMTFLANQVNLVFNNIGLVLNSVL